MSCKMRPVADFVRWLAPIDAGFSLPYDATLMTTATALPFLSPSTVPDAAGHFGPYGGVFVPETLVTALDQLTAEYVWTIDQMKQRGLA